MKNSKFKRFVGAASGLLLAACSTVGAVLPVQAQSMANSDIKVMVMMEDVENGDLKLGANTSVGQMAISSVKDQFRRYNYQVIDQNTVAQVLDFTDKEEGGYSRAELKEFAMRAKARANEHPEFDVRALVIFSVFPRLEETTVDKNLVLQISGEVHDADNNTFLGKFGPETRQYGVGAGCKDSACISQVGREAANEIAAIVAHQARAELAKLTKNRAGESVVHRPSGAVSGSAREAAPAGGNELGARPQYSGLVTDYSIQFRNVKMNDIFQIKRVMDEEFPGAVPGGKIQGADPMVTYRYRSRAPQDKLYEWLHQLFYQMGYNVGQDILINMDGKTFKLQWVGSDLPQGNPRMGPFK